MSDKTIFGIDLGTTYSCIAYVDEHGQPVVVPNKEGDLTTPSVVFFENSENLVVGKHAKDAIRTDAPLVVSKVKRAMGNPDWTFDAHGKSYRPEDVSAFILCKIVDDARRETGREIEEVVITCPAYFGLAQKKATETAGAIAGLHVRYVIPEPTAAAIAYGASQTGVDTVLVYDLGGGTFDITLIDIQEKALNVLTTDGDAELGGHNWDTELAQFLAQKVSDETGASIDEVLSDVEFYADLLLAAEDMKKSLTNAQSAKQVLFFNGEKIRAEVAREDFDRITKPLLDRTIELTKAVVDRAAARGLATPKRFLLVGGSTYMPQVEMRLMAEFPGIEMRQQDPNQIVAKGAALYGLKVLLEDIAINILNNEDGTNETKTSLDDTDEKKRLEVITQAGAELGLTPAATINLGGRTVRNVTSRSFGLRVFEPELNAYRVANLVHVDGEVPTHVCKKFFLQSDQSAVEIVIFENEQRTSDAKPCTDEAYCINLAQAELDLGRVYPAGSPIEVTFTLSHDGLLDVMASHVETGKKIDIQLKVNGVMSDEEVALAKKRFSGLTIQ
jgi:molecular chaperone DnaK (HSP70)